MAVVVFDRQHWLDNIWAELRKKLLYIHDKDVCFVE